MNFKENGTISASLSNCSNKMSCSIHIVRLDSSMEEIVNDATSRQDNAKSCKLCLQSNKRFLTIGFAKLQLSAI